jgi:methylmalonyl-CoA epimerase
VAKLCPGAIVRKKPAVPATSAPTSTAMSVLPETTRDALYELPLDHVAIAVPSLADALTLFKLLGRAASSTIETVASQSVRVAFVGSGPTRIELIEPIGDDSPVARFLARRGSGLHHIAYRAGDIERELQRLIDAGLEPIDREPRPGALGHRVAFLHPGGTAGVLVELVG